MDNNDISTFFYAEYEAGMYNATVALTTPLYDEAIDIALRITHRHCLKKQNGPIYLLDIGAGTGNESIGIMKNNPSVYTVAVDLCEPMKHEYMEKLNDAHIALDRVNYIVGDVFNMDDKALCAFGNEKFDVAFSAYALHHYPLEKISRVFQTAYSLLDDDGLFFNLDLFRFDSDDLSEFAADEIFEFIEKEFENPDLKYPEAKKISIEERRRLKKMWLKHYAVDNQLTPIESQVSELRRIGFREVGMPFVYLENGLICAKKR